MRVRCWYEVNSFNPVHKNLHNHEATCVVCFRRQVTWFKLMMPAGNDCPSGWTEKCHGFLMTGYYNHKKQRDFIWVDKDVEYTPGTQANSNGVFLYLVERVCGSLPCKAYDNGKWWARAVRTKWPKTTITVKTKATVKSQTSDLGDFM